jgi:hypothetical protein
MPITVQSLKSASEPRGEAKRLLQAESTIDKLRTENIELRRQCEEIKVAFTIVIIGVIINYCALTK